MGFLTPSELIARVRCRGAARAGFSRRLAWCGAVAIGSVLIPYFNRLFGQAKRVRP